MSARTKTSGLNAINAIPEIDKLGILAGGGELPRLLSARCEELGINPLIIGFEGQTDDETYGPYKSLKTRVAKSGTIFKWMHENDIKDVVFIGSIARPKLRSMIPDLTTLIFFLTKGIWARGDNAILIAARDELERRGFKLHGAHRFLPELITPVGDMTKTECEAFEADIALGLKESQALGRADIGQAVIVKGGAVIGREDQKGTNALIHKYGEEGAVLVKTCKPQQDKDLDLPTIGPNTIRACIDSNMAGIAIHAGNSLFLHRDEAIETADKKNIFITGVNL